MERGRKCGFAVEKIDAFKVGEDIVSSTLIGNLILKGDMKKVTTLLGRWINVEGIVEKGHGRGVGLGFPTANIKTQKVLHPAAGIYAAYAFWRDKRYLAAVNIGAKPTLRIMFPLLKFFCLTSAANSGGRPLMFTLWRSCGISLNLTVLKN